MIQKSLMWIYDEADNFVKFRKIHNLEIKHFPLIAFILQIGWMLTSFSYVKSILSNATSIEIPAWVFWVLAALCLITAHAVLNITYLTALKRKFDGHSYGVYLIFPAILMVGLFFADQRGSEKMVGSLAYKAQIKDLNHNFYETRAQEARARFDTEKFEIEQRIKSDIANATAWERREIKRFEAMPQTAWTAKKINEFHATIAQISSRIQRKYDKKINSIAAQRDTTLSQIFFERSNESTLLGKMNIAALNKEQQGEQEASGAGWFISLFFLLSYIVINYRIEYCRKNGGISRDESITPLEAYGGIIGYAITIFKESFTRRIVGLINKIAGQTENTIDIREITSSFNILQSTTNPIATNNTRHVVQGFANSTVQNTSNVQNTPVQKTNNVQNVQNTPVQNINNVQTALYTIDELNAQFTLLKEKVNVYVRHLNRGTRRTPNTLEKIDEGILNVLNLTQRTTDQNAIATIKNWCDGIRDLEVVKKLREEVQNEKN